MNTPSEVTTSSMTSNFSKVAIQHFAVQLIISIFFITGLRYGDQNFRPDIQIEVLVISVVAFISNIFLIPFPKMLIAEIKRRWPEISKKRIICLSSIILTPLFSFLFTISSLYYLGKNETTDRSSFLFKTFFPVIGPIGAAWVFFVIFFQGMNAIRGGSCDRSVVDTLSYWTTNTTTNVISSSSFEVRRGLCLKEEIKTLPTSKERIEEIRKFYNSYTLNPTGQILLMSVMVQNAIKAKDEVKLDELSKQNLSLSLDEQFIEMTDSQEARRSFLEYSNPLNLLSSSGAMETVLINGVLALVDFKYQITKGQTIAKGLAALKSRSEALAEPNKTQFRAKLSEIQAKYDGSRPARLIRFFKETRSGIFLANILGLKKDL